MLQDLTDYDILIVKYFDNEITPEETTDLWNWINQSQENKAHFQQTAKAWEKAAIELQDRAMAQKHLNIFSERLKTKKRRIFYRWAISSAAAIIFMFIGIQLFHPAFLFGDKMLTVITGNEKREVVLPDSSVVWLNAQSSLKYASKFTRSRDVRLIGEAYFDVKKDKSKPFSVHTNNITIEVLGTKFLITDRSDTNMTETTLESGKINLTLNASGKKIAMKPNQQVVYNSANGTTDIQIVNASDYTSWREKSLAFENTPLKDVFIQLGKWYNIEIECNNKTLLQTPVSFTVDTEPVEDILEILQRISSFTWEKNTSNNIIIS